MEFQIPSPLEVAVIIVFLILTAILLLIGHLDVIFSWLAIRKQKAVKDDMLLSDADLRELLEQSLQLNGNAFEARKAMIEAALEASRRRNEHGDGNGTDIDGDWSAENAANEPE